jgi:Type I phosphodiesterase / nucleotide pyrophosphatase
VTVFPRYGVSTVADVLPSALAALGAPGVTDRLGLGQRLGPVRKVALILVDGLGWHQLGPAAPYAPTLTELARTGQVLTSAFPSTTPTSLVSLGTGTGPGAHGIVGFTVNMPGTDRVVVHTHWSDDPDPAVWQPVPTCFESTGGVDMVVVSRPEFEGTGLSVAAYRGGRYLGASGVDEIAATVLAVLDRATAPTLVYGYHADLDRVGHAVGVDSDAWREAVSGVDRLLTKVVDGLPPDAALLVTADHGQVDVPLDRRFDLDLDPRLRAGVRVVAGEPRVRYLHTRPGATADVLATWRGVLGDAAWVVERAEAVAAGWFGPVREEHLTRVGDVVAACRDRYIVVASHTKPVRESQLVAYHGSFTAAEMEIPLLVVPAR